MMQRITLSTVYEGQLRTRSVHNASGNQLITDAPTDNHGKGEAFSPTDLLCTALCTCMITLMGITANKEGIDIQGLRADVVKIMASNPRKVATVRINFYHDGIQASEEQLEKLYQAARTCPVALSLSENLKQEVTFDFKKI